MNWTNLLWAMSSIIIVILNNDDFRILWMLWGWSHNGDNVRSWRLESFPKQKICWILNSIINISLTPRFSVDIISFLFYVQASRYWCVKGVELYFLLIILVVPALIMGFSYIKIIFEVFRVVKQRINMTGYAQGRKDTQV